MTDAAWESLSNQAVAAAGLLYFLALLAHLVEWASLRKVPLGTGAAARDSIDIPGGVAVASGPDSDEAEGRARRTALFGRLGYLITCIAVAVQALSLFARGMAADPNRVPWGNMYEFTLTGTFVVAFLYVVLYRKFRLAWMAPIVLAIDIRDVYSRIRSTVAYPSGIARAAATTAVATAARARRAPAAIHASRNLR